MTTPTTPATAPAIVAEAGRVVRRTKIPADKFEIRWLGDPDIEVVLASAFDALAAENERLRGERDKLSRDVSLLEIVGKDQAKALRELRAKCEAHGRHYETERETNSLLNGENHALSYSVAALIAERDAATAEVGRLRAALRAIEERWTGSRRNHDCGDYERGYGQAEADIGQCARAALAPSPTNSDGADSEGEGV